MSFLFLRKEEVQLGLDAASLGQLLWTQRCRRGVIKGRSKVFHNERIDYGTTKLTRVCAPCRPAPT